MHIFCLAFLSVLALAAPSVAFASDAQDFVNAQGNLEFQIDSTRSLQLAKPSATCNSANEGAVFYDSTTAHSLKLCNGTAWVLSATGASVSLGSAVTTTSPARSDDASTGLFSATASTVSIATAGTERLRITAIGSVGIGTTGPNNPLQVGTDLGFLSSNPTIVFNLYYNSGWKYLTSNYAGFIQENYSSGGLLFGVAASGTAGAAATTTNAMFIGSTGNVGIGTTIPTGKLDIQGSSATNAYTAPSDAADLRILSSNNRSYDGAIIEIGGASGATGYIKAEALNNNSGAMTFGTRRTSNAATMQPTMTLDNVGYVGIGITGPSYMLHVAGTAYADGAAGALSDIRHKKNVKDLTLDGLTTISKLRPVAYEWKDPKDKGMMGEQLGFIAQEVEKVLPQIILTQENDEKTKGLKYNELTPVLVKAIQELKALNDEQTADIAALRKEFQSYKATHP